MEIDIRTPKGKKLFEWNPETKTITIVIKKHRYQVEQQSACATKAENG